VPETPEKFWSMKGIAANKQYRSEYVGVTLDGTLSVSEQEGFINLRSCRAGTAFSPIDKNAIRSPDKAHFFQLF
jgi:hypothetical protein